MILTDEEIEASVKTGGVSWTGYRVDSHGFYTIPILSPYHYQFAKAIEGAVLNKLCAGVSMPEPVGYLDGQGDCYTADQLRTVAAASRLKALEDAAVVCENESCSCCWTEDATEMASHLQDAIHALKGGAA